MKRFIVIVLICFLLGWNTGIMISNEILKVENQNLREEIKIYKDKNGVNIENVNQKNIWSLKCGGQNKCSGLKNIFPKTIPPNTCSVYLVKNFANTCLMKKQGRTSVSMLLVEHC